MADQIVPLTSDPNQTLTVALTVDAKTLTLRFGVNYNEVGKYWLLQIYDRFGNLLLANVPLLTGYWPAANILQQNGGLGIGSAYVVNASGAAADYPDAAGLGTDFLLVWGDTAP